MSWTEECLECGYLLSGDDKYRGHTVKCPKCKSGVAIPGSDDDAGYGLTALSPEEQAKLDAELPPAEQQPNTFNIRTKGRRIGRAKVRSGGGAPVEPESAGSSSGFDLASSSADAVVHLPCPKGHVLEIERSMMGNWAMCPHCGEQFEMLLKNTEEYQRERAQAEQREIARSSQKWMNYAIVAIVLVVLFLGLLIALAVAT